MRITTKDLIVVAITGATSLLTAIALAYCDLSFDFSVYGFMLWFVVPIGALLSGGVAASGCYFAAKALNHKPGGFVLLGVLAISAMTFFVVNYLDYYYLSVDGAQLHDYLSFTTYLNTSLNNQSMSFCYHAACTSSGLDLGAFGYLVAGLQILGFFLGGATVYGMLSSAIYCDNCSRYYTLKKYLNRYFPHSALAATHYGEMLALLREGQYQEAIARQSISDTAVNRYEEELLSIMELRYCATCLKHHIKFFLKVRQKKEWKELHKSVVSFYTAERFEPAAS
jgi:hypothetical protein